jgi:hypothetical protein
MVAKRTPKNTAKTFTEMIAIRVSTEDADRLDALAERLPVASRHAIAREALRIGFAVLEKDPTRLVRDTVGLPTKRRSRS